MLRSDSEIEHDVKAELAWDRRVDADDIAVAVVSGVVLLSGFTHGYSQRYEAEAAAKRVAGVAGVANDVEVRLSAADERSDPQIARDALAALRGQLPYSSEQIKVTVEHGWLALEGALEWNYQRELAAKAVRRIAGVRGVSNLLQIVAVPSHGDVVGQIEQALARSAVLDATQISVETREAGVIVLRGSVRSWAERETVEQAAWSAPGVTRTENLITVSW